MRKNKSNAIQTSTAPTKVNLNKINNIFLGIMCHAFHIKKYSERWQRAIKMFPNACIGAKKKECRQVGIKCSNRTAQNAVQTKLLAHRFAVSA